jgi:hypothetical protein
VVQPGNTKNRTDIIRMMEELDELARGARKPKLLYFFPFYQAARAHINSFLATAGVEDWVVMARAAMSLKLVPPETPMLQFRPVLHRKMREIFKQAKNHERFYFFVTFHLNDIIESWQ